MRSVVSDLSPFYLARARDNLAYWRSLRQPGRQLGGVDGNGVDFQQAAAEAIDSPDQAFDVVGGGAHVDRTAVRPRRVWMRAIRLELPRGG
jgi:hypothetical protein